MIDINWLKNKRKILLVHTIIICVFLFFLIFLSEPLFDVFEKITGEAELNQFELTDETNNIRYNIDHFLLSQINYLEITGWAFIEGYDTENKETYIVLRSHDKTYIFNAETISRSDVTRYFKELNLNLDYSGFTILIPVRKISNGEYNIGIYIKKDNIEALEYTDKLFKK